MDVILEHVVGYNIFRQGVSLFPSRSVCRIQFFAMYVVQQLLFHGPFRQGRQHNSEIAGVKINTFCQYFLMCLTVRSTTYLHVQSHWYISSPLPEEAAEPGFMYMIVGNIIW